MCAALHCPFHRTWQRCHCNTMSAGANRKPTRNPLKRLTGEDKRWEEGQADHKEEGGHELDAPCCTETGRAGDETATVADEEHDEDSPLDRQLLNHNDGSSLLLLRDLRQIHRHLARRHAHTNPIKYPTSNQHSRTITSNLNGRPREPKEARKENGVSTTDVVGKGTSAGGTDDGTSG